jgi:hypothetical protein
MPVMRDDEWRHKRSEFGLRIAIFFSAATVQHPYEFAVSSYIPTLSVQSFVLNKYLNICTFFDLERLSRNSQWPGYV